MRLPHGADLPLPAYQSALAAGLDLLAAVAADAPVAIAPGARALIPTGIAIALPPNSEGQIRPRSGMAIHHGVTVLNAPGTIDPDFRGELQVVLVNHGAETVVITRHGRAIARLVPEEDRRQREIDDAIASMKARGQRNGKISVKEILSAIHEGHKY